jgi:hypothetical protein
MCLCLWIHRWGAFRSAVKSKKGGDPSTTETVGVYPPHLDQCPTDLRYGRPRRAWRLGGGLVVCDRRFHPQNRVNCFKLLSEIRLMHKVTDVTVTGSITAHTHEHTPHTPSPLPTSVRWTCRRCSRFATACAMRRDHLQVLVCSASRRTPREREAGRGEHTQTRWMMIATFTTPGCITSSLQSSHHSTSN